MTTWKDRGIVPDSDDEDNSESQNFEGKDDKSSVSENWETLQPLESDVANLCSSLPVRKDGLEQSAAVISGEDAWNLDEPTPPVNGSDPYGVKPNIVLSSSPLPQPVFRIPRTFESADGNSLAGHSSQQVPTPPEVDQAVSPAKSVDEISTSYVSLSSPPSSFESGEHWLARQTGRPIFRTPSPETREHTGLSYEISPETYYNEQAVFLGMRIAAERPLRVRNAIQLHPYALERERYRRRLKASGVRPLRMVQNNDSEDGDEGGSLSSGAENENGHQDQPGEVPSEDAHTEQGVPTTPTVGHDQGSAEIYSLADSHESSENEQHMRQRSEEILIRSRKRTLPTYSKMTKRRKSSFSMIPSIAGRPFREDPSKFNVQSPPTTSSPRFQLNDGEGYDSPSTSDSLEMFADDFKSCEQFPNAGLPTPTTSVSRETIDLTEARSDSASVPLRDVERDDPISLDGDDIIEVRRVRKRIKGVLPASWLRLDQQGTQKDVSRDRRRYTRVNSYPESRIRKGVAVPIPSTSKRDMTVVQDVFTSMSSAESESDDERIMQDQAPLARENNDIRSFSDRDDIAEDDPIDAMLTGHQKAGQRTRNLKTSRPMFRKTTRNNLPQPRITDILPEMSRYRQQDRIDGTAVDNVLSYQRPRQRKVTKPLQSTSSKPLKLSILDFVARVEDVSLEVPRFIRIATRNARSRRDHGKQSPTRKFIRLQTEEDTFDADSTLNEWKAGVLRPHSRKHQPTRKPLAPISQSIRSSNGIQPKISAFLPQTTEKPSPNMLPPSRPQAIAVDGESHTAAAEPRGSVRRLNPKVIDRRKGKMVKLRNARPAQIETQEDTYRQQHPALAFKSTKKKLDSLYRQDHRPQSRKAGEVQLQRYLEDDNPPISAASPVHLDEDAAASAFEEDQSHQRAITTTQLPKKKTPQRLDIRTRRFRQPVPLPISEGTSTIVASDGKLQGLPAFGTKLSVDMGIIPLPKETYFHESTFIGSGKLAKVLEFTPSHYNSIRGVAAYQVQERHLRWRQWDDIVSSELGICFDVVLDCLFDAQDNSSSKGISLKQEDTISFILDYVSEHLCFSQPADRISFVARILELQNIFLEQIGHATKDKEVPTTHAAVATLSRNCLLIMKTLQIARSDEAGFEMSIHLEALLQRSTSICAEMLLVRGTSYLRDFLDNLHNLSVREIGIRSDQFAIEAWVILIHIFRKAQIPKVTVWTIVNPQLFPSDFDETQDFHLFEKCWISLFTLLPIFDLNANGTITRNRRTTNNSDNWEAPQRLIKRVFFLYETKTKQAPNFNSYCRACLVRCFCLIEQWGWRRCITIIGSVFDFFARHNLSHLRNEEVYTSPRFLQELADGPSLQPDDEDRCFHILLKIVAASLKQLHSTGDTKSIRNLLIRLIPNHDRQYPKERPIHQHDLASLRNHHDLLCTLFYAAPTEIRSPLHHIQALVSPAKSHREASLINLRAWTFLASYVVATYTDSGDFQPLAVWYRDVLGQFISQYDAAGQETEVQLLELPQDTRDLVTMAMQRDIIDRNRNVVLADIDFAMSSFMKAVSTTSHNDVSSIQGCDINVLAYCYGSIKDVLTQMIQLFQRQISSSLEANSRILAGCPQRIDKFLELIDFYIYSLKTSVALGNSHLVIESETADIEDDSQDYGSLADFAHPWTEYATVLNGDICDAMFNFVQFILDIPSQVIDNETMEHIINTWGAWIRILVQAQSRDAGDFFSVNGTYSVFGHVCSERTELFTPLLWSAFIGDSKGGVISFEEHDINILSEWIKCLVKPAQLLKYSRDFTQSLLKAGIIDAFQLSTDSVMKFTNESPEIIHSEVKTVKSAIRTISDLVSDERKLLNAYPHIPAERIRQNLFHTVQILISTLKSHAVTITRQSTDTTSSTNSLVYFNFVFDVAQYLSIYFAGFSAFEKPLKSLLSETEVSLPNMPAEMSRLGVPSNNELVSTLRRYNCRTHLERGQQELYHCCFSSLKAMTMQSHQTESGNARFKQILCQALESRHSADDVVHEWSKLEHQLFVCLTPAMVHVSFTAINGYCVSRPFLRAANSRLEKLIFVDPAMVVDIISAIYMSITQEISKLASINASTGAEGESSPLHPQTLSALGDAMKFVSKSAKLAREAISSIPNGSASSLKIEMALRRFRLFANLALKHTDHLVNLSDAMFGGSGESSEIEAQVEVQDRLLSISAEGHLQCVGCHRDLSLPDGLAAFSKAPNEEYQPLGFANAVIADIENNWDTSNLDGDDSPFARSFIKIKTSQRFMPTDMVALTKGNWDGLIRRLHQDLTELLVVEHAWEYLTGSEIGRQARREALEYFPLGFI